ncbi:MAG: FAD-dependent oxidoreductase [Rickettsiales bacterium]
MRIVVVGGGICGILSAYYALRDRTDSHVHIIERREEAGCETSAANASQYAYTDMVPVGRPELFGMLPRLLAGRVPGMGLSYYSAETLLWSLRLLFHSLPSVSRKDAAHIAHMAATSLAHMDAIMQETGVSMRDESRRKITLFKDQKEADAYRRLFGASPLHRFYDAGDVGQFLPGLNVSFPPIGGAMVGESDRTGRCAAFCRDMREHMEKRFPDRFRFEAGAEATRWVKKGETITAVTLADGRQVETDAAIICAGPKANALLAPLGDRLPLLPVRGHTVAFSLPNAEKYVSMAVVDYPQRVMYIPLGDTLSVSGGFRFGLCSKERDDADVAYLKHCGALRLPALKNAPYLVHSGYRPCVPSSRPVVRRVRGARNAAINGGHGMYGWTLAAATAKEAVAAL